MAHYDTAAQVTEATAAYRRESDTVARFLDERTVSAAQARVSVAELFGDYEQWAREDGSDPLRKRQFSEQVEVQGFEKYRASSGFHFRGLGLVCEEAA